MTAAAGDAPVLVSGRHSPVWTLTLNRPHHRNAVDGSLHQGLLDAMETVAADRDVRAVVLTGTGSSFSAGGDLELIRQMQTDAEVRRVTFDRSRALFRAFLGLPVPIVAAVNGPAVGAGCTWALLCDVVLMSDTAKLSDPRVAFGLVSGDGGAVLWPILAGLPAARVHLLTGDAMSADEAFRVGLAHRVLPADEVLPAARALADRLAAFPAGAMRATKRALNGHLATAASEIFEAALTAESESLDDPEHRAATEALAARIRRSSERRL